MQSPARDLWARAWFGNRSDARARLLAVPGSRLRRLAGALALFALVLLVYLPILPGSFLMDDRRLVETDNPLLTGELMPATIWFQTDFALSTVGFWVEWTLWGSSPAGYHVVSLLLHGLSALLLWRLLARLRVPGAWLAGALFAVHPVCVNSVARIAELKNTLSLPLFLLSFRGYLEYEALALFPAAPEQTGRAHRCRATLGYTGALIAFVLALLAKTSVAMLPVLLLACATWQRKRITRSDLVHTAPFFLLALAFGLMSVWFQKHQALAMAGLSVPPESFAERMAIAGRAIWFYLGKAALPLNLSLAYPRWHPEAGLLAACAPGLLLGAVLALVWRFRDSWGRHALFGLACFVLALFPALGFFDAQFLTRWQVSDHLQYLPLMALLALAAGGLASRAGGKALAGVSAVLLLVLSALTWQRAAVFATEENLMRDTLAKNPAAAGAHNDLGVILARRGDFAGAVDHFDASLRCDPDCAEAHLNFAQALVCQGRFADSVSHYQAALQLRPGDPAIHKQYARSLARAGNVREAIRHLELALRGENASRADIDARLELASLLYQAGEWRASTSRFREVVRLKPDQPEALNNLAWALATCAEPGLRDGTEAVRCAEQACRLTQFKQPGMISTLAAAYAEAGRFPDAVAAAENACQMQTNAGDAQGAALNRHLLAFYRSGKPWHAELARAQRP